MLNKPFQVCTDPAAVTAELLVAGGLLSVCPLTVSLTCFKTAVTLSDLFVRGRWECNPVRAAERPVQGPDVRLRVSGWKSLSSALHCRPEERWGLSKRTGGSCWTMCMQCSLRSIQQHTQGSLTWWMAGVYCGRGPNSSYLTHSGKGLQPPVAPLKIKYGI